MTKNFVADILGSSAVPLFFFFSSYLQFLKHDSYLVLLKKRFKSLFLPYIIWTVITVMILWIAQLFPFTASYFQNPSNIIQNWNFGDWLKIFYIHTTSGREFYPLVTQFWFIRDLMIFIILSPVLTYLAKKAPFFILLIFVIISNNNIPIYITSRSSSLLFYMAGYYCATYKIDFFKVADRIKLVEYILLISIVILCEYAFEAKYSLNILGIIIVCLFFLKVSSNLILNNGLYLFLKNCSELAFFVYAIHSPIVSTTINKLTCRYMVLHGINCLFQYIIAGSLTLFISVFIALIIRKIFPKVFQILNGGR